MCRTSLGLFLIAATLYAGILPTVNLDADALRSFEQFIGKYESGPNQSFASSGAMWMDAQNGSRKRDIDAGRPVTEMLLGENVSGGHINHLFGSVHIPGASVATFVNTMQNYGRYPEYFKADIAKGAAKTQPDSSPASQHFRVFLEMMHSTMWMDVAYATKYDTRYVYPSRNRLISTSKSVNIREYRDAHDPSQGTYPEGADHGFLWRTYTSWHARERDGGLDLELNSMSLSRQVPAAAGWWANRTARATTERMIQNTALAIRKNVGPSQARAALADR